MHSPSKARKDYDNSVVTIFSLVASHKKVDLGTVAHLANGASGLPQHRLALNLKGLVLLSTCNRLEIYGELRWLAGLDQQALQAEVDRAAQAIFRLLAQQSALSYEVVAQSFEVFTNQDAAQHLFTVATGLESAVVGEREITGQVRRAIGQAQEAGQASGNLVRLFDHASQTARQVGQQTLLGSRGRSVVSVALDLADELAEQSWPQRRVLIFGSGAYAGATVAALRERGCSNISVYSRSGRANTFADKRAITPVAPADFEQAFAAADVVVGCSGSSRPLQPAEIPEGRRVILDLALSRDFSTEVADLPDVDLITLESVRLAAPSETDDSIKLARIIVDKASAEFAIKAKVRHIDTAIVALREHTLSVLDSELEKVRHQYGCGAAADQVELAMRRMVKSLLHTPTVRARTLAQEGREAEYVSALEALYGIEVESSEASEKEPDDFRQADAS